MLPNLINQPTLSQVFPPKIPLPLPTFATSPNLVPIESFECENTLISLLSPLNQLIFRSLLKSPLGETHYDDKKMLSQILFFKIIQFSTPPNQY